MSKEAHIICIAAGKGEGRYSPNLGFTPFGDKGISEIKGNVWVGPRQTLETIKPNAESSPFPQYLQVIPYYLIENNGKYLRYVRPVAGNDDRLHGKVSIGIGGHIDLADAFIDNKGMIDLAKTLEKAGKREGKEEIGLDIQDGSFRYVGTIYATTTEVDKVHLGIVGICHVDDETAASITKSEEIEDHDFKTFDEIQAEVQDEGKFLETWTHLIIESASLI
jgi:predicted NUDIX family phosphoesterase